MSPQQGFSSNDRVEMTTAWQEARLGFKNRTTSGTTFIHRARDCKSHWLRWFLFLCLVVPNYQLKL